MAHHTITDRRETLDRIVTTPTALPDFDLAAFRALPRAEQARRWFSWTYVEQMRAAHTAMNAVHGYSDADGAHHYRNAMDAKFAQARW